MTSGRVIMSQTGATPKDSGTVEALFSFPNPVNEVSARLVAGGVVVMCVLTIASTSNGLPRLSRTDSLPES